MSLARTFSFEDHDEQVLSSNEQERQGYQYQQQHSPYRDTYARDLVSPPPQYASPPPRDFVSPPSPTRSPRYHPSAHPDSHYNPPRDHVVRRPVPSRQLEDFDGTPPPPPPHRSSPTRTDRYEDPQSQGWRPQSFVTPGADYFGDRSGGGGLDRIAQGAADRNQRESGVEALRAMERSSPPRTYFPQERDHYDSSPEPPSQRPSRYQERASYASTMPLAAGAATPGSTTPRASLSASPDPRFTGRNIPLDDYPSTAYGGYNDSPYHNPALGHNHALSEASINPHNIADDGDDGFIPDPRRKSMLDLMNQRSSDGQPKRTYPSEARTASGGPLGALGGVFSRAPKNQTSSGSYNPVGQSGGTEKAPRSEWLARQTQGNNKMRWVVGGVIITVVVLAVIAGVIGGVISSKKSASSSGVDPNSNDNTAAGDTAANGDLDKNSPQIKALLNNPNLHKVFPGMDYTPWGTQYPLCMTYPPSQNNVTRDMAMLSQLTNAVRLYGTDCNQTEMVLHSIDRLGLTDMKVWLGVWVDTNDTTTQRQLAQMYTILEETKDISIFKGAIVGNEALYRAGLDKASSENQLVQILTDVKANFTKLGYDLPVATSDLGDNWNAQLVDAVDLVMSNIHPFFAGVSATEAAAWTLEFWEGHDKILTQGTSKGQVISETGWPSAGGRDCGGSTGDCTGAQLTSTDVSVAGIDEMNTFLDAWVCGALENGTEYFWFEAFDEPWKIVYNTPGKEWEDKWGLMDPSRNLKDGLIIPECGGKTVGSS